MDKTTNVAPVTRQATETELQRMGSWLAWGYRRGQRLALWPDKAITLYDPEKTSPGYIAVLSKDAQ